MAEYIDTKYLFKCETCRHHRSGSCDTWCENGEVYSPNMSKIPTADVVEVVRCKDCRHGSKCTDGYYTCRVDHRLAHDEDDFCSYGERKSDENNS